MSKCVGWWQMLIDNLLIVGNGFDLNLNLKTQYKDFIGGDDSPSEEFEEFKKDNVELAEAIQFYSKDELWNGIENDLAQISLQIQQIRKQELEYEDQRSYEPYGEITTLSFASSLECPERGHLIKFLKLSKGDTFLDQYRNLKKSLCGYVGRICNESNLDDKSEAYKLLIGLLSNTENTYIVDFNYTSSIANIINDCYVRFYRPDASAFIQRSLIKIHGKYQNYSIVFGVQDDIPIDPSHTFLRKGVSPHLWSKMLVSDLMKQTRQHIHIFGHSLGPSDHTQFRDYFTDFSGLKNNKAKLNVYHYGDAGFYGLFKELDSLTGNQLTRFKATHDLEMINTEG